MSARTLALALMAAAYLPSTPALASTTTAVSFIETVGGYVAGGDLASARHLLVKLRDLGVVSLRIGGHDVAVESLIDRLRTTRAAMTFAELVAASRMSSVAYVWCDHWASRINLAAPAEMPDMFGASSHGCEA